jgi:S1-C subfamily serine protease
VRCAPQCSNGRMITRNIVLIALLALASVAGCTRNADDAVVASVRRLRPGVVLLSMRVPPEEKKDRYDDAYATGFVVASGGWGSDILTVQHAVDGAWHLHITIANRWKAPAKVVASNEDLDLALLRTPRRNLTVVPLGSSTHLQTDVGRELGLLGYPIPDEFDDEGLGLATSLDTGRLSSIRKDALEVTLSIVPGESGAPVFIADTGEVVGVAESRFDEERSIGFALPVDDVKKFLHRSDAGHGF